MVPMDVSLRYQHNLQNGNWQGEFLRIAKPLERAGIDPKFSPHKAELPVQDASHNPESAFVGVFAIAWVPLQNARVMAGNSHLHLHQHPKLVNFFKIVAPSSMV